jgi:hypothetical protein
VVATISNPTDFPVTITVVEPPTSSTHADGYVDSALTNPRSGCQASSPSDVSWNFANGTSASSHSLTGLITVAATTGQSDNPLTVTFTDDAFMSSEAPARCENSYFSMAAPSRSPLPEAQPPPMSVR